jgi:hypothetical protein
MLNFLKQKKKPEVILSIDIRRILLDIVEELYGDSDKFKEARTNCDYAVVEGIFGSVKFYKEINRNETKR